MKQVISLSMAAVLSLSACGPQGSSAPDVQKNEQIKASTQYPELISLLSGERTNMTWAEFLAADIAQEVAGTVNSSFDVVRMSTTLKERDLGWKRNQWKALAEGSPVIFNSDFTGETLISQMRQLQGSGVFDTKVQFENAVLINNESLKRIFDTYNKQLVNNAKQLARDMVKSWSQTQPNLIREIDSVRADTAERKAQEILVLMKKWDKKIAAYDLPDEDNAKLLIYSLVAAQLAEVLQNHTTVKQILTLIREVQGIAQTARETFVLIQSISEYRKQLAKDWSEMGSAFQGMMSSVTYYKSQISPKQMALSEETRDGIRNIVEDVLTGSTKSSDDPQAKSFLQKAYPLDEDFNKFVDSAVKVSTSVEGLIGVTRGIAKSLNISLSPEVEQILSTTQQVIQAVKLGQSVMQAFQAQGMIGALSVFSGGGAMMLAAGFMGGGGSGNAEVLSAIADLKKDIKEVKEMQKKILENQLATMEMVKDVAVMIDQYHRENMAGFERLTDQVLVIGEVLNIMRLSDLNDCRLMLGNVMEGQEKKYALAKTNTFNLSSSRADVVLKQKNLLKYVNSPFGAQKAQACVRAFERVFEPAWPIADGNLLDRHTGNIRETNKIVTEKKLFMPALAYLNKVSPHLDWTTAGLHIPVASFAGYEKFKSIQASHLKSSENMSELENLLSPYLLEKYGVTLLETYLALYGLSDDGTKIARRQVKEALHRTNIAIAQLAVLSGEPLMEPLLVEWQKIREMKNCSQLELTQKEWNESFCFVTSNDVILNNLVAYRIYKILQNENRNAYVRYNDLRERKDLAGMAQFLGVVVGDLEVTTKGLSLKFDKKSVVLPVVAENKPLLLQYDSSMPMLLKLQTALSQELVRLTPQYLTTEQTRQLAENLVRRNIR